MAKQLLAGWKYLGGKTQRYLNASTGQELSRRQYDKLAGVMNYEKKAAHNKIINPELAAIRPARGRKSHLKSPEWIKKEIAAQRLEAAKLKKQAEDRAKDEREQERRAARLLGKKVKVKTVARRYFPKGKKGWRIPFNTYADYVKLLKQARDTKAILSYALGYVAVDERTGNYRPVTVFTVRSLSMVESEDEFYSAMFASIEQYAYLKLAHYFIHFVIMRDKVKQ